MKKIVFEDLFRVSNEQQIIYNGKIISIGDKIELRKKEVKFKLTFLSSKSKYKQGIVVGTKGTIVFDNNETFKNHVAIWGDNFSEEIFFLVKSKNNILWIQNMWENFSLTLDPFIDRGHNGAAMYIEEQSDGSKIYYCNDIEPDDDFDDLIFKLEILD